MKIPFTVDQFFGVFAQYNTAIWPMQVIAYVLAAVALSLIFMKKAYASRFMAGTLAAMWVWMGAVYHIGHFRQINPAALIFGVMFIIQGGLFLYYGIVKNRVQLMDVSGAIPLVGVLFVLYAMVIYPGLGAFLGHRYPAIPLFGIAPCPTTIFTMGVLLWSTSTVPWLLLPIPFIWSLVGMSAAVSLRVPQDYGLVIAGILGSVLIIIRNRRSERSGKPSASLA